MIEVFPNLFVGNGGDLALAWSVHGGPWVDRPMAQIRSGWSIVTAAKDPWHRELLGYTERGAPKDHPEYLWATRERRLFLNLVDAPNPDYIREEIISTAIEFVDKAIEGGDKVLIHCNKGESRAPTIALLWLRFHKFTSPFLCHLTFEDAAAAFAAEIYPPYNPGDGMCKRAEMIWEEAARE